MSLISEISSPMIWDWPAPIMSFLTTYPRTHAEFQRRLGHAPRFCGCLLLCYSTRQPGEWWSLRRSDWISVWSCPRKAVEMGGRVRRNVPWCRKNARWWWSLDLRGVGGGLDFLFLSIVFAKGYRVAAWNDCRVARCFAMSCEDRLLERLRVCKEGLSCKGRLCWLAAKVSSRSDAGHFESWCGSDCFRAAVVWRLRCAGWGCAVDYQV